MNGYACDLSAMELINPLTAIEASQNTKSSSRINELSIASGMQNIYLMEQIRRK